MDLGTLFLVGFIGAITPGPDILLVLHNSLRFGAWQGIKVLCGIATGWFVFLGIIYFGFAHLLRGDLVQLLLSGLGGLYLLYIAYHLLKKNFCPPIFDGQDSNELDSLSKNLHSSQSSPLDSAITHTSLQDSDSETIQAIHIENKPASYLKGLIINLSNPKAILFFSVIIAPFVGNDLGLSLSVLYVSLVSGFLSVILASVYFREYLNEKTFYLIDKICGVLFILFACSLFYHAFEMFNVVFFNES